MKAHDKKSDFYSKFCPHKMLCPSRSFDDCMPISSRCRVVLKSPIETPVARKLLFMRFYRPRENLWKIWHHSFTRSHFNRRWNFAVENVIVKKGLGCTDVRPSISTDLRNRPTAKKSQWMRRHWTDFPCCAYGRANFPRLGDSAQQSSHARFG